MGAIIRFRVDSRVGKGMKGTGIMSSFHDTPIYVSERSARNFWQDYRVFPDRVELRCWLLLIRFVILAEDILDVKVRPRFSIGDQFQGRVRIRWWALKLDWSDFFDHVEIHRKWRLFKYIRFTPDNPERFVAAVKSIRRGQAGDSHPVDGTVPG